MGKKKSKELTYTISLEDKGIAREINELKNILRFDNLKSDEVSAIENMISKKKTKLVEDVYRTAHPRAKEELFYQLADGRWKSKKPDFYAKSREELVEKLYKFFFVHTFKEVYLEWVSMRIRNGVKSKKTIQEDLSILKNVYEKEPFIDMQIGEIKKRDIKYMYERWTGQGLITKKAFGNRKSALNGVFTFAAENDYIPINFIPSIGTSELKFKEPRHINKAFYREEREKLLRYLRTLKQDGYTLAIQLALYSTFRIGELRAIKHEDISGNILHIGHQLVEESDYSIDTMYMEVSKEPRQINEKLPKGNSHFSVRNVTLISDAVKIIEEARRINPDGEYLFMCNGRPLNNDTFNERLRKYCKEAGVPYLSSHKLRYTVASILFASGVEIAYLQKTLGHSNRAMTEHYIYETVDEPVDMTEALNSILAVS
ncbi:MAG: site-specific integrase [Lachnospiraceae bacterium]|nr:site-specific integrase [Lachnospiraceae bacterium]